MQKHYSGLLSYINQVVESLKNEQKEIIPILRALGKRHIKYEVA